MNCLVGIGPNQLRICGGPDAVQEKRDEIDAVMEVCASNLDLYLASYAKCNDLSTAFPTGHILKGKLERVA
jgi:hypothetical protein